MLGVEDGAFGSWKMVDVVFWLGSLDVPSLHGCFCSEVVRSEF